MKKRIFIAIKVPEWLKKIAENHIQPFYQEKFVRIPLEKDWHITLLFCGYLNDLELKKLEEILKKIIKETKPFYLNPTTILFMPPNKPRMIWLKFKNNPSFSKLKEQIENFILKEQKDGLFKNFRAERRAAIPHLTLGRFDQRHFHKFKKLLPNKGIKVSTNKKSLLVNSIHIMESHLRSTGARYELISSFIFKNM